MIPCSLVAQQQHFRGTLYTEHCELYTEHCALYTEHCALTELNCRNHEIGSHRLESHNLRYERKNSFGINFVDISQIQFIVLVMITSIFQLQMQRGFNLHSGLKFSHMVLEVNVATLRKAEFCSPWNLRKSQELIRLLFRVIFWMYLHNGN